MADDLISKKAEKAFEKIKDQMAWNRMDTLLKKHKTRLKDEIKKGSSTKKAQGLQGGGSAQRGFGRAFLKGGKV